MIQRPKNITDKQWEQAIALYNTAKSKGDRYPELTVAQAALETGWFKSPSGKYNYFGQKASKNQQGTTLSTKEMSGNKTYSTKDKFRDYNSIEEAVDDRIKKWGSKYKNAETVDDAINSIWQYDPKTGQGKGYATDVNYGSKLKSILGSLGISSGTSNPKSTETQLPEYVNFADVGELPSSQGIVFGEEEIKETEEKKPEGVKAADKLNELSFVEELKNLYESEPIQEQQQQVYAEALPTVQVTPLEYSPIQLQKGGEIMVTPNGVFDSGFNPVIVPSNKISMAGVPFNIEAISMETGERKLLKPEENFTFKNTKNVLEIPQFKK